MTVTKYYACPSSFSFVYDKRTSAVSQAAYQEGRITNTVETMSRKIFVGTRARPS